MKQSLRHIYNKTVPLRLRAKIDNIRYLRDLDLLRKKIIRFYSKSSPENVNSEQIEVLDYLKDNQVCNFPYSFQFDYNPENIEVFRDNEKELCYVFLNGKRLYFKRSWTENVIRSKFNSLLIEQDENSPHRYLTNDFSVESDSTVVDIGVAEGNFSLSIIDRIKKIYLFETDPEWIEALEVTFAPWKEKTEIINKYVSNSNRDNHISLDSFFKKREEVDFLKIDVDGSEAELLNGCDRILKEWRHLKIALCTYHKQEDEKTFSELLKNYSFQVSHSKGYMIFINDGLDLYPPYLRRGLIRAKK